ncbi:CDP-glycerol glycerophosphotransferase [Nocardioides albertanoniae]|uniref:CDP-glycerol glycerophosphotransferase n=1 Tax=Nocardioides albertanoniae TaxID=1175486 RepID=A0A543A2A9_9ACTN|nr:CDP-glycerol glycerophosphotransferase family protein [Nocardioides albertanoniae]TQL66596.1 CDP-glycerol glycerophosphotransferase [Nocardioides albertanoniae]
MSPRRRAAHRVADAIDRTMNVDSRRVARAARREARRARYVVGLGPKPILSVVMPIYNVEQWVGAALDSILTQSLHALEVIVVDDGSPDGSADVVRQIARRDPRVRIVTKENGGLGAARNTGLEHIRGEYVAFADSDDIILPGSYEAMVGLLERTGSDFVTAAFERGEQGRAARPNWVKKLTRVTRTRLRIEDEPLALLDITSWNKVFRTSFVDEHGLLFSEGVRYEDQVPITRAYLDATFDILDQCVYLWRTRDDGTSITQQKATLQDLADRILSQDRCAELVQDAPTEVRNTWFVKLLDYDFPNYVEAAIGAGSAEYATAVRERLAVLRDEIPSEIWSRLQFRNRVVSWALSHDDFDLVNDLRGWFQRFQSGRPIGVVDGRPVFVLPEGLDPRGTLPPDTLRVEEVDLLPRVQLTSAAWHDTELVLRGSAFLQNLTDDYAPHELRLHVRGDGVDLEVPVTRFTDPWLDEIANRAYEDRANAGFEARIDALKLAEVTPAGQHDLVLDFEHTQGDFTRVSGITGQVPSGPAGFREAHMLADRLVRLGGNGANGFRVHVQDDWARTAGHSVAADGTVELTVVGPERNPILNPDFGKVVRRGTDGAVTVLLNPRRSRELEVKLTSGSYVPVRWSEEPNVLGADAGTDAGRAYVVRSGGNTVRVTNRQPSVHISAIDATEERLVLRGVSLGAAGHRLQLSSERADAVASDVLPAGEFEIEVPVARDAWQLGRTALPTGRYELRLIDELGEVRPFAHVKVSTSLRAHGPIDIDIDGASVRIGVSNSWSLIVISHALPVDVRPGRTQQLLRERYLEQRHEPRLPVALLETFKGKMAGDSPAAMARELLARHRAGEGPEPVFSINDRSVLVPDGIRSVVRFSPEWYELLARAAYLVTNDNWPFFFEKAEGQAYVQTWHGTPLKRIAKDITDPQGGLSVLYMKTMDAEAKAWDRLISPSPYCSEILPRAFGFEGEVLESGYPRNDVLAAGDRDQVRAAIRKRLDIPDDQRVVLYTPTWRDSFSKVLYLDPEKVVAALPDVTVLVRGHVNTSTGASVAPELAGRIRDVTLYPDINDLFLAADVLVTDYSSVMFDFAILDRPQLFLVPDLEEYEASRGFYFDFVDTAPGPLFDDNETLIAHLAGGPEADAAYADARAAFREKFAPWDDGSASVRAVDALLSAAPSPAAVPAAPSPAAGTAAPSPAAGTAAEACD